MAIKWHSIYEERAVNCRRQMVRAPSQTISVSVCVIAIATEKLPIFYTFFRCSIHLQITGSTFLFIEAIVK